MHFATQRGSKVTIDGNCTVHGWQVNSQTINGSFEAGTGFPFEPGTKIKPGKIEAHADVSVPVSSLKSDLVTERTAHQLLNVNQATPSIHYRLNELIAQAPPKSKEAGYEFDSRGALVVAGVTNQISMPIRVTPLGGGKLKIAGAIPLKLSAFGIKPPSIWTTPDSKNNRTMEIKLSEDEVKLSFEWLLEQEAVAAPKR